MPSEVREPSSFRDPSGFLFRRDGLLLRQVNRAYERDYRALIDSGLQQELTERRLLVTSEALGPGAALTEGALDVLRPEIVPFVSYPYEWPFHALKDAALATLEIQRRALARGITLRDASAFNVQFVAGRPLLIDSLSFGVYEEGRPWEAYRQFCQHFLAPLALMALVDPRLGRLSQVHLDGVPLDLASKLAPRSSRWKPGLALHLHAHARALAKATGARAGDAAGRVSKVAMLGLIDSLESTVRALEWRPERTAWSGYYGDTNYSEAAMESKRALVGAFLDLVPRPLRSVWDLGANVGEFSALAAARGAHTVAWDFDHACVDAHYMKTRERSDGLVLPLVLDLTNPTPAIGWAHEERLSLVERGPVDAVMALALVHHLAIANNVPLRRVAELFARIGRWAVVEFVPKEDSQVKRLLASRADVFPDYTQQGFESAFDAQFETVRRERVEGSERTLYLLRRRSDA